MTLIKSISGMRGTIGGSPGDNLTPIDIVEFASAYAKYIFSSSNTHDTTRKKVVIGRDGRISGHLVQDLVTNTLLMAGIDVVNIGLSTTPTVEMEVVAQAANGGIIITASHNPKQWNALKFLNSAGEFISAQIGQELLDTIKTRDFNYAPVDQLGSICKVDDAIQRHIDKILALDTVYATEIRKTKYKVVVDCINSTGGLAMKPLLEQLSCECILINDQINGEFAHNPEPLEDNLTQLSEAVRSHKAHLGVAVDPDVDRLAFVDENGKYCGEEYTLVMIADWVLSINKGNTVSNMSSTIALREITEKHGMTYAAAAVGEVNVVNKILEINAIIGGEGNGGIIYPTLHAGRDALVGVALLLTALAHHKVSLSKYRSQYPDYCIIKEKIQLTPDLNVDHLLSKILDHFSDYETDTQDGVKIYFDDGWVHIRKSNTEPIIRLITESKDNAATVALSDGVRTIISQHI